MKISKTIKALGVSAFFASTALAATSAVSLSTESTQNNSTDERSMTLFLTGVAGCLASPLMTMLALWILKKTENNSEETLPILVESASSQTNKSDSLNLSIQ